MILKSMSRKEPSFGQLAAYMSDEKSERDFDLHQHLFSRDPEIIAREFEENARLLGKRRGGNYLFHEILSIDTRACGQNREVKEKLRLVALEFISQRCPRSMVYGALHRDHAGHLHYHLMISANERGEPKRQRLSPGQFNDKKQEIERFARETYPELKQDKIMDLTRAEQVERRETRKSRKEQEMEKRGAKLTKKEQLAQELRGMMAYAKSQAEFERLLQDKGFEFYINGKNFCIREILPEDSIKKRPTAYRFAKLGIHEAYVGFQELVEPVIEESRVAGEKEKADDVEHVLHSDRVEQPEEAEAERDGAEPDNESYGNKDSNADLKNNHNSQQDAIFEQERQDQNQKDAGMSEKSLTEPTVERRELIDKGHIKPDTGKDKMTHEDWREQDTFLGKVKQSVRRTFDDLRGRTKDLEEKAQGKQPDKPQSKRDKPQKQPDRSAQQDKWRSDMKRNRETGRDDPEQGRE